MKISAALPAAALNRAPAASGNPTWPGIRPGGRDLSPDDDGFLKTIEIAASGQITNTVIDTLEFDTVQGREANIIQARGVIYAIAYRGPGDDGFLQTVMILSDGTIGNVSHINGDVSLTLW